MSATMTEHTLTEPADRPPAAQYDRHITSSQTSSLMIDFGWRKFTARLYKPDTPEENAYLIKFHLIKAPHLVCTRVADDKVIANGTNSAISINCEYEVNGHKGEIRAAKRLATEYTHLSYAFADSAGNPMAMKWTTEAGFKNWDFICCDHNSQPVARFHSNVWYVNKVGTMEFLGERSQTREAQEELIIVATTIYNQMLIRIQNPLNLIGSVAKPKPFVGAGDQVQGEGPRDDDASEIELISTKPKSD